MLLSDPLTPSVQNFPTEFVERRPFTLSIQICSTGLVERRPYPFLSLLSLRGSSRDDLMQTFTGDVERRLPVPTSLFYHVKRSRGHKTFAFCRKPSSAQCLSRGLSAALLVHGLDSVLGVFCCSFGGCCYAFDHCTEPPL